MVQSNKGVELAEGEMLFGGKVNCYSNSSKMATFAIINSILLISCSESPIRTTVNSPDGKYGVEMDIENSGAGISTHATLYLSDYAANPEFKNKKIFFGKGGWPIGVSWVSNTTIVVEFCGGNYVEYQPVIESDKNYPKKISLDLQISRARQGSFGGDCP
jgi:hypothetical protein